MQRLSAEPTDTDTDRGYRRSERRSTRHVVPLMTAATTSLLRLAHDHSAQTAEQRRRAHRLLQDGGGVARRPRELRISRGNDDVDALLMEPLNQTVGQLAVAQIEVDDRGVRSLLGGEA